MINPLDNDSIYNEILKLTQEDKIGWVNSYESLSVIISSSQVNNRTPMYNARKNAISICIYKVSLRYFLTIDGFDIKECEPDLINVIEEQIKQRSMDNRQRSILAVFAESE